MRVVSSNVPSLVTGKYVFWHSTAHVLGEAMERVYGGCLCYGPPIDEGFYYDMHLEDGQVRDMKGRVTVWCALCTLVGPGRRDGETALGWARDVR